MKRFNLQHELKRSASCQTCAPTSDITRMLVFCLNTIFIYICMCRFKRLPTKVVCIIRRFKDRLAEQLGDVEAAGLTAQVPNKEQAAAVGHKAGFLSDLTSSS